jgi:glutaminyl-peptide cyclotransferase
MNPRMRLALCAVLGACGGLLLGGCTPYEPQTFSGARAYDLARELLDFGPRVAGSEASLKAAFWIVDRLAEGDWEAVPDVGEYRETPVRNIAAWRGRGPIVILGAHYDSRRCADQPDGGCPQPVLGANDGASGVAVLLELARTLDLDWAYNQVWLVFFDAEDNGGLDGWDWIVGSRQFTRQVEDAADSGAEFRAMVLLDMVGDADQQFHFEGNSDPALREEIWNVAADLGFGGYFIPSRKYTMIDDHIPFRDLGIPSVDVIDFDYPYWHTTEDSLDKLSADSLERVGRTIEAWLERGMATETPLAAGSGAERVDRIA